jgi:hypothetical protein
MLARLAFIPVLSTVVASSLVSVSVAGGPISPFTAEGQARGLDYLMMTYPPQNGFYGFGCGFADFDGDGDPDIFSLGTVSGTIAIYENVGGSFVDRTNTAGLLFLASVSSLVTADYDGDGDVDIYVSRFYEPAKLYRNEGGFVFADVSDAAGISTTRLTKGACWATSTTTVGWISIPATTSTSSASRSSPRISSGKTTATGPSSTSARASA